MNAGPGAAALVMAGVPVERAEETVAEYAGAGIGALLFPGALLGDPERLAGLTGLARRLAAEAGRPPVLCAAGGWAAPASTWPSFPWLPSPLAVAALGDGALARREAGRLGFLAGVALARAGIDLVFGPSLDLATDPKAEGGILDGFGENPATAGRLGGAVSAGLARAGIADCAGRFPGCGSMVADQRLGLPKIPPSRERLEAFELPPFARAIHAGMPAILVARALVPALDGGRVPAARSDLVVEGLLRGRMAFRGLVVADALDSPRGGDPEGPGRGSVLSALAGCDLTIALGREAALAAAAALDEAAASGDLPLSRVSAARERLAGLLGRTRPARGKVVAGGVRRGAGRTAGLVLERVSERVAERAATLLRAPAARAGSRLALVHGDGLFVLVFLPPEDSPQAASREAFLEALAEELPGAEIHAAHADPSREEGLEVMAALAAPPPGLRQGEGREALALSFDAHLHPSQESLIHVLEESLPAVSVIATRDPYDAAFFPRSRALGAVYGFSAACARTAARLARGSFQAHGRCPVEVLGLEV